MDGSMSVYCLQFDADKIVVGLRDTTMVIYDRHTLTRLAIFRGHTYATLLQHELGRERRTLSGSHAWGWGHGSASVLCLQYDGTKIISGSTDASVKVRRRVHGGHPFRVGLMAGRPDVGIVPPPQRGTRSLSRSGVCRPARAQPRCLGMCSPSSACASTRLCW